jgi:hypothetical protein
MEKILRSISPFFVVAGEAERVDVSPRSEKNFEDFLPSSVVFFNDSLSPLYQMCTSM